MSRHHDGHEPVLRVEDLSVTFFVRQSFFRARPIKAVSDVNLELARGETVAVVGESGSGKTTLGRATLHLAPISAGRIVFEGSDVGELEGADLIEDAGPPARGGNAILVDRQRSRVRLEAGSGFDPGASAIDP